MFDEGIDNKKRLERAFETWVASVKRDSPKAFDLLINKTAEFRDDEITPPLQAADLLAWHSRCSMEAEIEKQNYDDPVWLALQKIRIEPYGYNPAGLADLLGRALSGMMFLKHGGATPIVRGTSLYKI